LTTPNHNPNVAGESNGIGFRTGKGRSIAQHGELFQGQIEDENHQLRRCLMSLPCKALYSEADFVPDTSGTFVVTPSYKSKVKKAAELTREHLKLPHLGGTIKVESTIPETKGYGSSTADCIAAARSIADAVGHTWAEEQLAQLVVQAEVASDNFMFSRAVLFAHREGVVLEDYAQHLPKLEVIGVDTSEDSYVDTLEHPPARYSWRQLQSFRTLTGALRRAIRLGDIHLLGRVATASAVINEHFLPKPRFREVLRTAESAGALGVAVAHSGTVLGVLFDPEDPELDRKSEQLGKGLRRLGVSEVRRFQT
jgi:uncharacterized protein involved in propanediol utilization